MVDLGVFLSYPASIMGFLSIVAGLLAVFLLHEPNMVELTYKTRRKKIVVGDESSC